MKCSLRFAMQPAMCISFLLSFAIADTLHSRGTVRSASLLQRDSALQTEAVHILASTPHEELSDPYAPKHAGSPTLTKYCQEGHSIDPACKADAKTEALVDEISAVKRHMRCMFHPETCPPGMDPTDTHVASKQDAKSDGQSAGSSAGKVGHGGGTENGGASGSGMGSGGNAGSGAGEIHVGDGGTSRNGSASSGKSAGANSGADNGGVGNSGAGRSGATTSAGNAGAISGGPGSGSGGAGTGNVGDDDALRHSKGSGGPVKGGEGNGGADSGGAGTDGGVRGGTSKDGVSNTGAGNNGSGGSTDSSEAGHCIDTPNWRDANGHSCGEYAGGTWCDDHGDHTGPGGDTARSACCACGGGTQTALCTDASFKTRVTEHHGDSDESFRAADTNRDRSISRSEFQTLGSGVSCSVVSSNKVFESFKRGSKSDPGDEEIVDEDLISEGVYKDYLLATTKEVARRLREKHDSPEEAFAAADTDHSNSLTEREVDTQCTKVARPDACQVVQDRLGHSPSRQEYEDFVEYGHLPLAASTTTTEAAPSTAPTTAPTRVVDSVTKVADSFSRSTSAPKGAAGERRVTSAIRQEARVARQDVENKVVEIAELKHKLEEEELLDPELGRAMTGVIEGGEVFSGALEDVGDGKVTDADAALAEVEKKADDVEVAAFDLETGVHPHGLKWWRFRWEYSLVEAIMLIFLIFLVILTHACISKGQSITSVFMPTKMVGFSSMLNLHNIVFTTCVKEFAVLGVLQGVIWIMSQFGFFDWMLSVLPVQEVREPMAMAQMSGALSLTQIAPGFSMHLPNTGADLVYTLRCVNMHLFLGIAFYFLVMYHVVVSTIHIFSMFMEAEDHGAYEKYLSALSIEDFLSGTPRDPDLRDGSSLTVAGQGGLPQRRTTSLESLVGSSTSVALRWTGGCLKKTEDFQNVRRYFIHHILLREDLCEHLVREAGLADRQELDDTLHRVYLYRYLSVHIRRRLMEMIIIDLRIWLAMAFVLVCDIVLHMYAHVSFVELLPLYITFAFAIQVWQIFHAHTQLKRIVAHEADDEIVGNTSFSERQGNSFTQRHRVDEWTVRVQQLILLLICYSGARVMASPYLWTDYFKLSCFISAVLLLIYVFHVFIGSIWITLDMIVYSLPPYINDDEKDALVETICEAKSYSKTISVVPF